jgi:hypothetical protein
MPGESGNDSTTPAEPRHAKLLTADRLARIAVHVNDARFRRDPLRDLMRIVNCRQAGADIKELAYTLLTGQITDGTSEEVTVGAGGPDQFRYESENLAADFLVNGDNDLYRRASNSRSGPSGKPSYRYPGDGPWPEVMACSR